MVKGKFKMRFKYLSPIGLAVTAILIAFLLVQLRASSGTCLEIRIWSLSEQYLTLEPIAVYYEIENNTTVSISTTFAAYGEFFNILNQNGIKCENTMMGCYLFGADTLGPGSTYTNFEEIGGRYNVNSPGTYTCVIEVPKNEIYPNCSRDMKSNELIITIVEPTGEEKAALELYQSLDSLGAVQKTPDQKREYREQRSRLFRDLAKKYPKSVYTPRALYLVILMNDVVDDKTELIKICHTLIEDYSDSPYVKWTFLHLYEFHKEIDDKAGAMEYMEYLLDKYPDNETISERAGFWLEKIKKEEF